MEQKPGQLTRNKAKVVAYVRLCQCVRVCVFIWIFVIVVVVDVVVAERVPFR